MANSLSQGGSAASFSGGASNLLENSWGGLLGGVLVVAIIIFLLFWYRASKVQTFLDYMPTAVEPCPSDYRCGATTKEQVAMENNLWSDLREANKYTLPETVTRDQYDVVPTEAEPTSCMLWRSSIARETPMPEGQFTPYEEIERRYLAHIPRENCILKAAADRAEASMTATECPKAG